jgi:flagellar biosynthesis/type III secretory pathway M-ring protein FliF/YscJ
MSKKDSFSKSLYRHRPETNAKGVSNSDKADKDLVEELQKKLQEIIQNDPQKAARLFEAWLEAENAESDDIESKRSKKD